MEFEVTEIKMLGSGIGRSLSLRLEKVPHPNTAQSTGSGDPGRALYTVHAVVPFSAEFGTVQVGQKFKFEQTETPLQERVVNNHLADVLAENLTCTQAGCVGDSSIGTMFHKVGCAMHRGKALLK